MFPMNGHMPFSSHFYSLNVNGVHFITFSADLLADDLMNQEFDADQSLDLQFNWLENDLAKANENRHLTPWIIVFVSESIDCSNPSCSSTKLDKYKKKYFYFKFWNKKILKIMQTKFKNRSLIIRVRC